MAFVVSLLLLWVSFGLSEAFQVFTNSSVPTNASLACGTALSANVSCNSIVFAFQPGNYYTANLLASACTADCNAALASWQADIDAECDGISWIDSYNETAAIQTMPDLVRYNFNQTCRMNSDSYCNVVIGQAANGTSANSTENACSVCAIQALQFAAGSPYYDGPLLQSQSIYQSYTSSCKVSGYPLTTSTLGFVPPPISTTTTTAASPTCTGTTYTIQSGDDCNSISLTQGIGTMWLLTDNNLEAYCNNFPTSGTLCLDDTCSVYTVQQNDTCDTIAAAYNSSLTQLLAWNPVIDAGCDNLNNSIGYQICVDEPGLKYTPPTVSVVAPTSFSTPAPVPTNVAAETNTDCGEYYMAVPGDYCNLIVLKFGISLSDFVFLNPAINDNCTNLFAEESYCVEAVGDINTYSGRPGYASSTSTYSTVAFTDFPTATYVATTINSTGLPLAPDTRSDCNIYIDGSDYQFNNTDVGNFTECDTVASYWGIPTLDLAVWNPSLNTSASNCTLSPDYSYCAILVAAPTPTAVTTIEAPIRDGASANCTFYYDVESPMTCQDLLNDACLTIAQLYAYNPAVESDCTGLWLGYQYCVRTLDYVDEVCNVSSTTSVTTTFTSSLTSGSQTGTVITTGTPGAPTQSGEPANCVKWYTAQSGDSCSSVETEFLLTDAQFHAWNPAISADCSTGFWADEAYCVGTSDYDPNPTTTTSASATTTTTAVAIPSPTQPNSIISSCNKYAQAPSGDWCDDFATNNGITDAELYAWNSVLGSDGSDCGTEFWSLYYYCVGVSS